MTESRFSTGRGFTLIELLIVVAIIAILAAIAVPNFLEAQVRSKVARVRSDQRAIAGALESYYTDYNDFPESPWDEGSLVEALSALTTPVAYITSLQFPDPFMDKTLQNGPGNFFPPGSVGSYRYFPYDGYWAISCHPDFIRQALVINSFGPDNRANYVEHLPYMALQNPSWKPVGQEPWYTGTINHYVDMIYDSTNGTRSAGDIPRFGGDLGIPQTF